MHMYLYIHIFVCFKSLSIYIHSFASFLMTFYYTTGLSQTHQVGRFKSSIYNVGKVFRGYGLPHHSSSGPSAY